MEGREIWPPPVARLLQDCCINTFSCFRSANQAKKTDKGPAPAEPVSKSKPKTLQMSEREETTSLFLN